MAISEHRNIFLSSVFFVLGFSVIFSLLGVLLQSVLADVSEQLIRWLSMIGGSFIILFGFFLLGIISLPWLEKKHTFKIKGSRSHFLTSFFFGAAFAVGWTPCVGPILGAVLALAVSQPAAAFPLLLSYAIGLGVPFLLVGLFAQKAQNWIRKSAGFLNIVSQVFGGILVLLGILVFTNELSRIANLAWASNLLLMLNIGGISATGSLGIGVAFLAGVASFLSPCVLPLIPAFLSYLASTVVQDA